MKEGGREGEVEGLHAKFHMNVFIVLAGFRWPETTIFGNYFLLSGSTVRPLLTDEGQVWCAEADRMSTPTRQFSTECVHCVGFRWPKTTILGNV